MLSSEVADRDSTTQTAPGQRVLVVVPVLDEAAHIEATLSSLLAYPPPGSFRVVVVDGGSSDRTPQLVEALAKLHPELHLMRNPARIQSAAINLAARRFGREADVLIRCDAHALYPTAFCSRLVATLERTGADAVVVPLDTVGSNCLQRAVAWASNSLIGTGGAAHRTGRAHGFVDHGHHAAFRMETFRRCGGYDESFTHNEDAEFDHRQRALGARVYLDGDIRLTYYPRADLAALWRQYFKYGAGRSRTVRRHPGSVRLRQLLVPLHLILALAAFALSPWFPALLAWPALYAAALAATSLGMAARRRSACGLLTGPVAAVMHTAWACGFLWKLIGWREQAWRSDMTAPLWSQPILDEASA